MDAQSGRDMEQNGALGDDLGAILAQLTVEQIRFLIARMEADSDTAACRACGISRSTMSHWSPEARAMLRQASGLMAQDGVITAMHIRRRNLAKAMAVKAAGLDSADERLRQSVATEIIEWELGRAVARTELTGAEGGALEVVYVNDWRETPSP